MSERSARRTCSNKGKLLLLLSSLSLSLSLMALNERREKGKKKDDRWKELSLVFLQETLSHSLTHSMTSAGREWCGQEERERVSG